MNLGTSTLVSVTACPRHRFRGNLKARSSNVSSQNATVCTPDPKTGLLTAEYVDIFGVPFSLIPFKGREPGGGAPPEDRPKHEVMALPERKQFEIRFPVVEGYVVSLKRNLIRCDVSTVART